MADSQTKKDKKKDFWGTADCAAGQNVRIAVITSGGDSPGMNPAVRAIARLGILQKVIVYRVMNGYTGLINDDIFECKWQDVAGIHREGGTRLGTARSMAFKTKEGRRTAASNLLKRKIRTLIVIGGDGSLTGANLLKSEWAEHVVAIKSQKKKGHHHKPLIVNESIPPLVLIGMVGTIDNDLPIGDMTIGSDTALHRITDAIDCLHSTAASHSCTFVVEVMGRNCGYLAVMAALSTGCDFVIIPEKPLPENWQDVINDTLDPLRVNKRHFIVLLAEGARDETGKPITITSVQEALSKNSHEVRTTILGHVQRGGSPSAIDRLISVFLAETALTRAIELAHSQSSHQAEVSVWKDGRCQLVPLQDVVGACKIVEKALNERDFETAFKLRGPTFKLAMDLFETFRSIDSLVPAVKKKGKRIGVLHMGGVAPGMNDALRSCVWWGLSQGHQMLGIRNGFSGLVEGDIRSLCVSDVRRLCGTAGAWLGARRTYRLEDCSAASRVIDYHQIDALIMIGGWEGYRMMIDIHNNRSVYQSFRKLQLICVPSTISNNLPCTQWTVGSDTALNVVSHSIDLLRSSAAAATRVFVVDILGTTGYMGVMGGIAGGTERKYIPEVPVTLETLAHDIEVINQSFKNGKKKAVMLHAAGLGNVFTLPFMQQLYASHGKGLFDVRTAELGHIMSGGQPSPQDRMLGTMLGAKAIDVLEETEDGPCKLHCVGWLENKPTLSNGVEMQIYMNLEDHSVFEPWWLSYESLVTKLTLEERLKPCSERKKEEE